MVIEDSLVDDIVFVVFGEEFFENFEGVLGIELGGSEDVADKNVGIFEFVGAVGILDGKRYDEGLVIFEKAGGKLVFERLEADDATGVEDVDSGRLVVGGLISGEAVELEICGIPGAEFVGDGGEDFAPVGEPAADSFNGIFGFFLVDAADFGAEHAGGGADDVAGAEGPEGESGFDADDERPEGNDDNEDSGNFDADGDGLDEFGFFEDDFFEDRIFDIFFEVGLAFLKGDFFADATPGFFEGLPVFFAEIATEDGEDGDKNRKETEDDKGGDADHEFYCSTE